MNQKKIPDNNLPIYLQKYKVNILDGKDNDTKAGSVTYTTVGAIPSNVKNERVWAFNLTGTLKPNVDKYHIVYDFSEVESSLKVKFKDFVSGTITICERVFDATKLIKDKYTYSIGDAKVIIELDTAKFDFRLKKETLFSYQLNINDDAYQQVFYPNYSVPPLSPPLSASSFVAKINGKRIDYWSIENNCYPKFKYLDFCNFYVSTGGVNVDGNAVIFISSDCSDVVKTLKFSENETQPNGNVLFKVSNINSTNNTFNLVMSYII